MTMEHKSHSPVSRATNTDDNHTFWRGDVMLSISLLTVQLLGAHAGIKSSDYEET